MGGVRGVFVLVLLFSYVFLGRGLLFGIVFE